MTPAPRVVVGTASLGDVVPLGPPDRRTLRHLDSFVDVGCTAFDLAASYRLGGTERLFGAWMASRGNRDRLFIVSKGAHPIPLLAPHRLTARALEDDLDASLARLRTNRIDLYLVHRDDPSARLEPVVEALARFERSGKILAWGVSNFAHDRIRAVDALARDAGTRVAASSTHFSLFEWKRAPFPGSVSIAGDAHRDAREFHASTSLPLFAWSPLGAGFASSRVSRAYDLEANHARLRRLDVVARARGMSVAKLALAYVLSQPFPTHVVVAAKIAARMRDNLDAANVTLGPDERRWLETGDESGAFTHERAVT
jgi:aryl-alcohol dehydrogenase-like predicted oxidoreductase